MNNRISGGDVIVNQSPFIDGLSLKEAEFKLANQIFIRALNKYKHIYEKLMTFFEDHNLLISDFNHIEDFNNFVRFFSSDVVNFLKSGVGEKYIVHKTNGHTLQSKILNLVHELIIDESDLSNLEVDSLDNKILNLTIGLNDFLEWFDNYESQVKMKSESDSIIDKLKEKEQDYVESINLANSKKTEQIYSGASARYIKFARIYDGFSYGVLLAILGIGVYVFINYPENNTNLLNFFLPKLLILSTLVTLATIFLRKASHLRKLHDQANQTSLELQALPLYLRNVNEHDHSEIYKNLADKYFGKELDQTQNDKIGDLMQNQIAAGTELIKASAEMLKAKDGSNSE